MANIRFNIHSTAMPDGMVRDIRVTDSGEVWGEFDQPKLKKLREVGQQFEPQVYHRCIAALDALQPASADATTDGVVIGRTDAGRTVFYMLSPPSAYSSGSAETKVWELILTICNRLGK